MSGDPEEPETYEVKVWEILPDNERTWEIKWKREEEEQK